MQQYPFEEKILFPPPPPPRGEVERNYRHDHDEYYELEKQVQEKDHHCRPPIESIHIVGTSNTMDGLSSKQQQRHKSYKTKSHNRTTSTTCCNHSNATSSKKSARTSSTTAGTSTSTLSLSSYLEKTSKYSSHSTCNNSRREVSRTSRHHKDHHHHHHHASGRQRRRHKHNHDDDKIEQPLQQQDEDDLSILCPYEEEEDDDEELMEQPNGDNTNEEPMIDTSMELDLDDDDDDDDDEEEDHLDLGGDDDDNNKMLPFTHFTIPTPMTKKTDTTTNRSSFITQPSITLESKCFVETPKKQDSTKRHKDKDSNNYCPEDDRMMLGKTITTTATAVPDLSATSAAAAASVAAFSCSVTAATEEMRSSSFLSSSYTMESEGAASNSDYYDDDDDDEDEDDDDDDNEEPTQTFSKNNLTPMTATASQLTPSKSCSDLMNHHDDENAEFYELAYRAKLDVQRRFSNVLPQDTTNAASMTTSTSNKKKMTTIVSLDFTRDVQPHLGRFLGQGQFGLVSELKQSFHYCRGKNSSSNHPTNNVVGSSYRLMDDTSMMETGSLLSTNAPNRALAIKMMRKEFVMTGDTNNDKTHAKFYNACRDMYTEVELLKRLTDHPNIIKLWGVSKEYYTKEQDDSNDNDELNLEVEENQDQEDQRGRRTQMLASAYSASNNNAPIHTNYFFVASRLYGTLNDRLKEWRLAFKKLSSQSSNVNAILKTAATSLFTSSNKKKNVYSSDGGGTSTTNSMIHKEQLRLLLEERLKALRDVSSAIHYMHSKHILQRDLKPDNIGFDHKGKVKLFDFGLGTQLPSPISSDGPLLLYHLTGMTGSLRYMAPENYNHCPYNESIDIYAFSIIVWQVITLSHLYPKYTTKQDIIANVILKGERPSLPLLDSTSHANFVEPTRSSSKEYALASAPSSSSTSTTTTTSLSLHMQVLLRNMWSIDISARPSSALVLEKLNREVNLVKEAYDPNVFLYIQQQQQEEENDMNKYDPFMMKKKKKKKKKEEHSNRHSTSTNKEPKTSTNRKNVSIRYDFNCEVAELQETSNIKGEDSPNKQRHLFLHEAKKFKSCATFLPPSSTNTVMGVYAAGTTQNGGTANRTSLRHTKHHHHHEQPSSSSKRISSKKQSNRLEGISERNQGGGGLNCNALLTKKHRSQRLDNNKNLEDLLTSLQLNDKASAPKKEGETKQQADKDDDEDTYYSLQGGDHAEQRPNYYKYRPSTYHRSSSRAKTNVLITSKASKDSLQCDALLLQHKDKAFRRMSSSLFVRRGSRK